MASPVGLVRVPLEAHAPRGHVPVGSHEVPRAGRPEGALQKLQTACCCSVLGLGLYLGALALLARNEQESVCVARALEEARWRCDRIGCTVAEAQQAKGKLVHSTCPVADVSLPTWTPKDFEGAAWLDGAFTTRAIKVRQHVSMLQCKETRHSRTEKGENNEDVTVDSWTYESTWTFEHIDSSSFEAWTNSGARQALEEGCGQGFQENPRFPMRSQYLAAATLVAGAFDVTRHLSQVSANAPVPLEQGQYQWPWSWAGMPSRERRVAKDGKPYTYTEFLFHYGEERGPKEWHEAQPQVQRRLAEDGGAYSLEEFVRHYGEESGRHRWAIAKPTADTSVAAEVSGNSVHTCDRQAPHIGCLKIAYTQSEATYVSHLAQLGGGGRTHAWTAPPSWMCARSAASNQVDLFSEGQQDANELVTTAQASNTRWTWLMRALGTLMSILGIQCFLQPFQTIADALDDALAWFLFVPLVGGLLDFLGDVASGAVGLSILLISIGVGVACSVAVVSAAWCVMRPVLGVPLLAGGLALLGFMAKAMLKYAAEGRIKRTKVQ